MFLERTWLIIFAELFFFCSEISSEVFKKLLQGYENKNKYGPFSEIPLLSALNAKQWVNMDRTFFLQPEMVIKRWNKAFGFSSSSVLIAF